MKETLYIPPIKPISLIPTTKSMNGIFTSILKTIHPITKFRQISIEGNSFNSSKYPVEKVVEQDPNFIYFSEDNLKPGKITFEFINNYIYLTNFSIQVGYQKYFPTSWNVSGFDGEKWIEVKKLTNLGYCGNPLCDHEFDTYAAENKGPFTKIQFVATGKRSDGSLDHVGHIQINSIELFGKLKIMTQIFTSCSTNFRYFTHFLFLLI